MNNLIWENKGHLKPPMDRFNSIHHLNDFIHQPITSLSDSSTLHSTKDIYDICILKKTLPGEKRKTITKWDHLFVHIWPGGVLNVSLCNSSPKSTLFSSSYMVENFELIFTLTRASPGALFPSVGL